MGRGRYLSCVSHFAMDALLTSYKWTEIRDLGLSSSNGCLFNTHHILILVKLLTIRHVKLNSSPNSESII